MPRRVQLAPVSGKVSELVDVFCKITGVPKGVESTVPQRDFQDRNASGDLEGPCGPCVDGRGLEKSLGLPLDESNVRDSIVFHALIRMRSLRSENSIILQACLRESTFSDRGGSGFGCIKELNSRRDSIGYATSI